MLNRVLQLLAILFSQSNFAFQCMFTSQHPREDGNTVYFRYLAAAFLKITHTSHPHLLRVGYGASFVSSWSERSFSCLPVLLCSFSIVVYSTSIYRESRVIEYGIWNGHTTCSPSCLYAAWSLYSTGSVNFVTWWWPVLYWCARSAIVAFQTTHKLSFISFTQGVFRNFTNNLRRCTGDKQTCFMEKDAEKW